MDYSAGLVRWYVVIRVHILLCRPVLCLITFLLADGLTFGTENNLSCRDFSHSDL